MFFTDCSSGETVTIQMLRNSRAEKINDMFQQLERRCSVVVCSVLRLQASYVFTLLLSTIRKQRLLQLITCENEKVKFRCIMGEDLHFDIKTDRSETDSS